MVDEPKITLKVKLDNIFQMISNKVTSWSQTPSNDKYPSEKLVKDSLDEKISKSNISGLIKNDGTVDTTSYSTFDGNYNNLTNKPSIPSKTSDLNNDSGFLTSHQSLSGYLQTSDVKDNLTSIDIDKPLSAKQGKELKTLVDGKANSTHNHSISDVTNLQTTLNDYVNKTDMSFDSDFLENFLQSLIDYGKINDKEWINL